MLKRNKLKQQLREEQTVYGLFCSLPSPQVVEMIAYAGYDFVIIDCEHTLMNPETLENMLRAAEASDITALVRVPVNEPNVILRTLDGGAQGIVVPHICTEQDVRNVVKAARYASEGQRSLNTGRPAGFAYMDVFSYLHQANEDILVTLLIEDRIGVQNLDAILAVPGIDMVLGGAADLSQSYGIPWQTRHPSIREILQDMQTRAMHHHIPFCAIPRETEDIMDWYLRGVRVFVLGDERNIAFRSFQRQLYMFQQKLQSMDKKNLECGESQS